jgi:hypothetical protein
LARDGCGGTDEKRGRARDATPESAPFDPAETKNQQCPRRQDHKDDEANEKINATR